MNIYLKEMMKKAQENGESEVNNGQISLADEFQDIFQDTGDYPISKRPQPHNSATPNPTLDLKSKIFTAMAGRKDQSEDRCEGFTEFMTEWKSERRSTLN